MFVGHTALALAAKARVREVPLALLIAAVFALDLLWPVFLLLGIERVRIVPGNTAFTPLAFDAYPWSHSLLLACAWGALLALVARRHRLLVGALVVSHWVLDVVAHRPDLPLWPGSSPLLGLGLWNSVAATLLVEGLLFAAAIYLYVRSSSPRDRMGSFALWSLLLLQTAIWASSPWAPPPPSPEAIAWVGLAGLLFVPWAAWIDGHRSARA
ncbi:MAG TPA: hypothetical protein VFV75_03435 [Candidatus Polarisedimenticolaceae bacterium]|nr:hypothetical protein [Candidatus Polarisedimenticolaceae bacterium]